MDNDTMNTNQELKSERVQEEIMAVDRVAEVKDPLVISLKAERVQEPAAATVPARGRLTSYLELAVNPYERVTIELPALDATIILEQPVAGASWNAGLDEGG